MGFRVKAAKSSEVEVFKVWDINWDAVRVFLALRTQWRIATLTTLERARLVRTGLDYAAIEPVRRSLGVKRRKGLLFAQLRTLEEAALIAYGEVAS